MADRDQHVRINLDAIVDLSQLIQEVIGRSLNPEESSRLKSAYQAAEKTPAGATIKSMRDSLHHSSTRQR